MFYVPPVVRETWPEPNFVDPVTRGPALVIVVSLFLVAAIAVVGLRCYTRLRVTSSFGSDDVLITIALIPTIGLAITLLVANVRFGWNRHIWDLLPAEFKPGEKLSFAASIQSAAASGLTKLSLLAFYQRLLPSTGARFYWWLIVGYMVLNIILSLTFIFDIVFTCSPVRAFWNFVPPLYHPTFPFHCRNHGDILFRASIINTINDFIILLIPVPLVWRLDLPIRQRLLVITLFGLGVLVCVAGALRTFFIFTSMMQSYDEQWQGCPLWIATTAEVDMGIICASAPALRPLVAKCMPKLLDQTVRRFSRTHSRKSSLEKRSIIDPIHWVFDEANSMLRRDSTIPDRSNPRASSDDLELGQEEIPRVPPLVALPSIPRSSTYEWVATFKNLPSPPLSARMNVSPVSDISPPSGVTGVQDRPSNHLGLLQPPPRFRDSSPGRSSTAETIRIMMMSPDFENPSTTLSPQPHHRSFSDTSTLPTTPLPRTQLYPPSCTLAQPPRPAATSYTPAPHFSRPRATTNPIPQYHPAHAHFQPSRPTEVALYSRPNLVSIHRSKASLDRENMLQRQQRQQ